MENEQLLIKEVEEEIIVKVLRNNEWQIENELVLKKRKVYISKDKELLKK